MKGGVLGKKKGMGKKTKSPKMIDSERKQGNFFSVEGGNDITVGESAVSTTTELGANAEKMSLEKIGGLIRVRLTWQVQRHRGYCNIDGKGA